MVACEKIQFYVFDWKICFREKWSLTIGGRTLKSYCMVAFTVFYSNILKLIKSSENNVQARKLNEPVSQFSS